MNSSMELMAVCLLKILSSACWFSLMMDVDRIYLDEDVGDMDNVSKVYCWCLAMLKLTSSNSISCCRWHCWRNHWNLNVRSRQIKIQDGRTNSKILRWMFMSGTIKRKHWIYIPAWLWPINHPCRKGNSQYFEPLQGKNWCRCPN